MTRLALLPLLALPALACGSSPTSPDETTASTTSATSSIVFEGVIPPGGSAFYSFTAYQLGTLKATLTNLSLTGHRDALTAAVRLGVGVPKGEGCEASQSADVSPGLVSQFSVQIGAGIYCLSITDIGNLGADAAFQVRFTAP